VSFATSNGTATAGNDYTALNQTVSFADGDATNKIVAIPIIDDTAVEGNETVNLTLSNPTGGAALGTATAVLTIIDNETTSPTVISSYSETNYDATMSLNDFRTVGGQVFTPSVSAYLRSSQFYLSKENNPTGTIVSKLYAVTGTPGSTAVPTGSPLSVSVGVDVSTLNSPWTNPALVTFDFTANQYLMSADVPYAIVVEYSGGTATNTVPIGKDKSSPTHPGNKVEKESGAWIADDGGDAIFYVYGDVVP
jgi:hypothetical protein